MQPNSLSIDEQKHNSSQAKRAQVAHQAFLLDRESAILTTPLRREESKLDRQVEVKSLQRNLLTQAANQPQGLAAPLTLLQLNQEY
jgi:hypothetical protein